MSDATTTELEPEDDPKGISWVNPGFIQAYGGLNEHTVMELFTTSPFYKEECINSVLARLRATKRPEERMHEEQHLLESYNGREYLLDNIWLSEDHCHALFTILRKYRKGTGVAEKPRLTTTGVYFVVDGIIFPSVTLLDVLRTYLVDSMHYYHKAMKHLSTFTQFDSVKNYEWNKDFNEEEEEKPDPVKNIEFMGQADTDHIGNLLMGWRQKFEVVVPPPAPPTTTPVATPKPPSQPPTPKPTTPSQQRPVTPATTTKKRAASDLKDPSSTKKIKLN